MDKRGDIHPDHTPDAEGRLLPGEKRGTEHEAVEQLDDDAFNRLAKRAADKHAPLYKRLAQ